MGSLGMLSEYFLFLEGVSKVRPGVLSELGDMSFGGVGGALQGKACFCRKSSKR